MPHATQPSPGLQALILCGPGLSLNTFTSSPKDFPKALIPIANRPMVWYPMDWCRRMGITDITLITPPESALPLEAALATNPALTSLTPKPEVLAPGELTQTTGTGELLRLPEVQKTITGDFMILPCDLVSELEGSKLMQQWMTLNPLSISSKAEKQKCGMGMFYPTQGLEGISHKKDETDFIATVALPKAPVPAPQGSLRQDVEELVLSMPTDTLKDLMEEDKESSLKIRQSLVEKHGRVKIKTKHRDSHVYIFPRWVKELAARNERLDSISEDVLGWWAKAGWQDGLGEKLGLEGVLGEKSAASPGEEGMAEANEEDIDVATLSTTSTSRPATMMAPTETPTFASRVKSSPAPPKQHIKPPPLLAYIQPSPPPHLTTPSPTTHPLIRRVDTASALLNTSLYLAKQSPETNHALAHEHKIHPTASVGQQSRISQEDSLVAENAKLGQRANIKESIIGPNCDIGNNARLTRCLLMDGVVVGEGVQLTGCIVGRRARIEGVVNLTGSAGGKAYAGIEGMERKSEGRRKGGEEDERTRLVDCEVAPGFVVEMGTQGKGEKLMGFDTEGFEDEDEDGEGEGMEL